MTVEQTLWELIQANAKHIEVINYELGAVQANIIWLSWWVRGIALGTGVTVLGTLANIVMTRKNGKRR